MRPNKSKEEILSELYAIRAVMSLVHDNIYSLWIEDKKIENKYRLTYLLNKKEDQFEKLKAEYQPHNEIELRWQFCKERLEMLLSYESYWCQSLILDDYENLCGINFPPISRSFYRKRRDKYSVPQSVKQDFLKRLNLESHLSMTRLFIQKEQNHLRMLEENFNTTLVDLRDDMQYRRASLMVASSVETYSIEEVKNYYTEEDQGKLRHISDNFNCASKTLVKKAAETYKIIEVNLWGDIDILIDYLESGKASDLREAHDLLEQHLLDEKARHEQYSREVIHIPGCNGLPTTESAFTKVQKREEEQFVQSIKILGKTLEKTIKRFSKMSYQMIKERLLLNYYIPSDTMARHCLEFIFADEQKGKR